MAALGWLIVVIAMTFLAAIFHGYVLSMLWGWFIVPVFNAPVLGVAPAIGVALLIGYLTKSRANKEKKEEKKQTFSERAEKFLYDDILNVATKASAVLFTGWIIHLFM